MRNHLFVVILLCMSSAAMAETCPTVADIKNNQFRTWQAFGSDSGEPLNHAQLEKFKRQIHRFNMAEWAEDAPEGESHCYYAAKNRDYADGFLAADHLQPDRTQPGWQIESGFVRCRQDTSACLFISGNK